MIDDIENAMADRHIQLAIIRAQNEVHDEIKIAFAKFPAMRSPHEGYAIIFEELWELFLEIIKQYDVRTPERMRKEAKQVAAMAIRFMVDLTDSADAKP